MTWYLELPAFGYAKMLGHAALSPIRSGYLTRIPMLNPIQKLT